MKKLFTILLIFLSGTAMGQQVSLENVLEKSRANYPLIRQYDLINKTREISIDNLSKNFLPQLSFSGQASYQSDVTKVNIPLPGVTIPSMAKDQYKVLAELSQLIYDGGAAKSQRNVLNAQSAVDLQQIETDLYAMEDRITQIYFSLLLNQSQLEQTQIIQEDVKAALAKTKSQVENGLILRSNLSLMQADQLTTEQTISTLRSNRHQLLQVLSLFTGDHYTDHTTFSWPESFADINDLEIYRPEVVLFDKQKELLDAQKDLLNAAVKPRANLFAQGGYGRPGLNMLDNSFSPFYIAGVRLGWNLSSLYTLSKNKELIDIKKRQIDTGKDVFLLNTKSQLINYSQTMNQYKELMGKDSLIINLRKEVKEAAKAQLENGVITTSDFLRELHAEDQARQMLVLHQLQWLQANMDYKRTIGNK